MTTQTHSTPNQPPPPPPNPPPTHPTHSFCPASPTTLCFFPSHTLPSHHRPPAHRQPPPTMLHRHEDTPPGPPCAFCWPSPPTHLPVNVCPAPPTPPPCPLLSAGPPPPLVRNVPCPPLYSPPFCPSINRTHATPTTPTKNYNQHLSPHHPMTKQTR